MKKNRANGEPAITVAEFRSRATKAMITGVRDEIGEVNELSEAIRGFYSEFEGPAREYGVIQSNQNFRAGIIREEENLNRLRTQLSQREKEAARMTGEEAELKGRIDNFGEARSEKAKKAKERMRKDLRAKGQGILSRGMEAERLKKEISEAETKIEEMKIDLQARANEPSEDYFTRVWNKDAIRANRENFKENIIKPWMVRQPWVQVFKEGRDEIAMKMNTLRRQGGPNLDERLAALQRQWDAAPAKSKFEWEKASTRPEDIEKRADEILETILEEAEPADLATLREANRPTFGRKRQFDIPNSHLLREGPNGNGLDDFIVTDPLRVGALYEARMAPAIEFARTFGRPMDGVSGPDGFMDAMMVARRAEREMWEKAKRIAGGRIEKTRRSFDQAMARAKARVDESENPAAGVELSREILTKARERLRELGLADVIVEAETRAGKNGGFSKELNTIFINPNLKNPLATLNHEAIHALKSRGAFKESEWKALEKAAWDMRSLFRTGG